MAEVKAGDRERASKLIESFEERYLAEYDSVGEQEDNERIALAIAEAREAGFAAGVASERRDWHRAAHLLVNESCSCGGRGLDNPGVCPACIAWHKAVKADPTLLDAAFGEARGAAESPEGDR